MKSRRAGIIGALCVTVVVLLIALTTRHVRLASDRYDAAVESFEALQRDVAELVELRAQRQVIAWKQRPTTDVLAEVNAALVEAGILSSRLRGIGEGADTPLAGPGEQNLPLRRQSLTVNLESLAPAEIGRFLHHWMRLQDQWSADRLELIHRRGEAQNDTYDLRLYITAVYYAGS